RTAVEVGVNDRVVFTGEVLDDDLVAHYCLGDVFVMPNRKLPSGDTEGFGLVFLEANSCGIPVIAGRDGGSGDAVQHGVNGLIVNGSSIGETAAAMLSLREDEALRDELGRRGLGAAAAADWRGKAEAFLQVCGEPERWPGAAASDAGRGLGAKAAEARGDPRL